MSPTYDFTVWGQTFEEIQEDALLELLRFWGGPGVIRHEIECQATMTVSGRILVVKGRVHSWKE